DGVEEEFGVSQVTTSNGFPLRRCFLAVHVGSLLEQSLSFIGFALEDQNMTFSGNGKGILLVCGDPFFEDLERLVKISCHNVTEAEVVLIFSLCRSLFKSRD